MTEQSATPEAGPLSVDEAVASLLSPPPEATETPEAAPTEAAADGDENTEGASSEPEAEPDAEAENLDEGDTDEAATQEPEKLPDPPLYWTPEGKAKWADLTPEARAEILAQEGPRETAVAKAKAEAQRQAEDAQKNSEGIRTLAEQLNNFLPEAIQTFQSRWGAKEPDWAGVADQYGADEAFKLKTRFETEQKQLATLAQAQQAAQTEAHKAFVQTEWKALAEIAPELAPDPTDPTKGAEKRQDVTKYLVGHGIPQGAIAQISAREMHIAHKAMLWDQAQAAMKAAPKPKPAASAAKAPVRPAAAQAQPSSQRNASDVASRFAKSRSVDDAVALLLARK